MGKVELGAADEECEAASRGEEASGSGKCRLEALDGAEGDNISLAGEVLGAGGEYIDVCQCKSADGFSQEYSFLLAGFNQGEVEVRRPDFDGQAGEAGAGAEVYDFGRTSVLHRLRHRAWAGRTAEGGCPHAGSARE